MRTAGSVRRRGKEDSTASVSRSVAKANALLDKGRRSDRGVALRDLASACDEVDLPALLKVQQEWYGSRKEVPVVGTGLFFLSIWSRELNKANAGTNGGQVSDLNRIPRAEVTSLRAAQEEPVAKVDLGTLREDEWTRVCMRDHPQSPIP